MCKLLMCELLMCGCVSNRSVFEIFQKVALGLEYNSGSKPLILGQEI